MEEIEINEKIYKFYLNFDSNIKDEKYDRCISEEFRNQLSKEFNFPQGHRWKFDEWFSIQEKAFKLLLNLNKIDEKEYNFYCQKVL